MSGQNWRFNIISDDDIHIEDIGIWLENFAHRAIDWDVDWDADDEHFEYTVNVEFEYPLHRACNECCEHSEILVIT